MAIQSDSSYGLVAHPENSGEESIPLTENEYNRILQSRKYLIASVLIEEKFGMLLENLVEFEQTLLDAALRYMMFANTDYPSVMRTLFLTTRRVQNLLSSARLYVDQVKHDLGKLYGKGSYQLGYFTEATHREYDRRLGYRVMEALRNFMQHRSLPLRYVSLSVRREKLSDPAKHTANPELDLKRINEEGGFKSKILAELGRLNDPPKLKVLVREYVEGLAIIQTDLRLLVQGEIEEAMQVLADTHNNFVHTTGKAARFLRLSKRVGNAPREETYLGPELVEQLQRLQRLYSRAQYITKTIVSSEA